MQISDVAVGLLCLAPGALCAQPYKIAFASFAPLDSDIFIADGDGKNEAPLLPSRALDYNASFSADGEWVIFTSERGGKDSRMKPHCIRTVRKPRPSSM